MLLNYCLKTSQKINLIPYEKIGLISFTMENGNSSLTEFATKRFLTELVQAQKGAHLIIELGILEDILKKIGRKSLDQETALLIGEHFGINAFFYGNIFSKVKHQVHSSYRYGTGGFKTKYNTLKAHITLSARLVSSQTGEILWTDRVDKKRTLAFLRQQWFTEPHIESKDTEEEFKKLIEELAQKLAKDFH